MNTVAIIDNKSIGYCYVLLDWNLLFELYGESKIHSITIEVTKFIAATFPGHLRWKDSVAVSNCTKKQAKNLFDDLCIETNKRKIPIPLRGIIFSYESECFDSESVTNLLKHWTLNPIAFQISDSNVSHISEKLVPLEYSVRVGSSIQLIYLIYTSTGIKICLSSSEVLDILKSFLVVCIYGIYGDSKVNIKQQLFVDHIRNRHNNYLENVMIRAKDRNVQTVVNILAYKSFEAEWLWNTMHRQDSLHSTEIFYATSRDLDTSISIESVGLDILAELAVIKNYLALPDVPTSPIIVHSVVTYI